MLNLLCLQLNTQTEVKLKDKIRNTIIRKRTFTSDIRKKKKKKSRWKWIVQIVRMNDNRWRIGSAEWQIKGVRSVGRPKTKTPSEK